MTRRPLGLALALGVAAILTQACGGVGFTRADGAYKYKALKMSQQIQVVESASTLQGATQIIGAISQTSKTGAGDGASERAAIVKSFSSLARRRGCDALVGLTKTESTGSGTRREKVVGAQGKVTWKKVKTTVATSTWNATCVRTEAAAGGFKTRKGKAVAKTAAPTPAPAQPGSSNTPPPPNNGTAPAPVPAPAPAPTAPVPPPTAPTVPAPTPPPTKVAAPTPVAPAAPAKVTAQAKTLWKALAAIQGTYLPQMKGKFAGEPATTLEALGPLSKVMSKVVSKKGFWRYTVPAKWFGCGSNAKSDACKRLANAVKKLDPFGVMQTSIGTLSEASASMWLTANNDKIVEFLRDYVPKSLDLTGMKETPFFKRHFAL